LAIKGAQASNPGGQGMRKLIVGTFVSIDGVMQAPGGPQEDTSGGFKHGGWLVPHFDETVGAAVDDLFNKPFDLLLGRFTYDIFAAHWPHQPTDPSAEGYDPGNAKIAKAFDMATKFVATHNPQTLGWMNSKALGPNVAMSVRELKQTNGPDLVVQGSSKLVHQLLAADLVDVIQLLIFPVMLGQGKRLFDGSEAPRSLKLLHSATSGTGVIAARYERRGEVTAGSFVPENPSDAEIERRKTVT
jgi:dihydrofolate reductase